MSTTTVSIRSTSRDAEIRELRRREAEARAAARRAAARAERQRREEARRAEAERRQEAREAEARKRLEEALTARAAAAERLVELQEDRFQAAVARLDAAARRLPDLNLAAPRLRSPPADAGRRPERLEAYAAHLEKVVNRFGADLDAAIAAAERRLERRLRTAAAWRSATDLERAVEARTAAGRAAAARLGEAFEPPILPVRPAETAEPEVVEAYAAALNHGLAALAAATGRLEARRATRERVAGLGGARLDAGDARRALDRHDNAVQAEAREALGRYAEATLAAAGLAGDDGPPGLRRLLDDALAEAHVQDQRERVGRWIARERQCREGAARAEALLQSAPDLVRDDAALARRWESLLGQLQRVAAGLEPFTATIEREYGQIEADARRLVNTAYGRADWVRAMSEQGFEVLEQEDGEGLVVVDLDHPEVWLEGPPLVAEDGGFAAILELRTDAEAPVDDGAVTDSVCARLARVTGEAGPNVAAEAEIIEREARITCGRRPARAMAQPW